MPISGQRFSQLEQKHDPNILMTKIRNLVHTLVIYTTESCKHDNICAFFHWNFFLMIFIWGCLSCTHIGR